MEGQRTYSSANILAARDTWSLGATNVVRRAHIRTNMRTVRTNDQGYHRGSIPSCRFQTFDQFLHFPDLDVLLRLAGDGIAHFGTLGRFKISVS